MGGDSNSDSKRASLDFFVPPDTSKPEIGGNDAQSYLEQRRQQHRNYLKTAKNAQKTIEDLRKKQEAIEKARKLK
jgi:hypothetical protein